MYKTKNKNIFVTDTSTNITIEDNDMIFLMDFEFDNQKQKTPISVGICSVDKKHQFYREFEFADNYKGVNSFVKENVIKHLSLTPKPTKEIIKDLNEFFAQFSDKNIYLLSDSYVDLAIFLGLNPNMQMPIRICTLNFYIGAKCSNTIFQNDDTMTAEKLANYHSLYTSKLEFFEEYDDYFIKHNIVQHQALNDSIVLATLMEKALND